MNKKKEVRNMKDEEKLLKAIHENHKKVQMEHRVEKAKKENERKEKLIAIIIVIITLLVLILNWKMTDKAIAECTEEGYTEGYCISKLA